MAYPEKKDSQLSFLISMAAKIHPKVKIEENAKIFFTDDCLTVPKLPTRIVAQITKLICEYMFKEIIRRGMIFCQHARTQINLQDSF